MFFCSVLTNLYCLPIYVLAVKLVNYFVDVCQLFHEYLSSPIRFTHFLHYHYFFNWSNFTNFFINLVVNLGELLIILNVCDQICKHNFFGVIKTWS